LDQSTTGYTMTPLWHDLIHTQRRGEVYLGQPFNSFLPVVFFLPGMGWSSSSSSLVYTVTFATAGFGASVTMNMEKSASLRVVDLAAFSLVRLLLFFFLRLRLPSSPVFGIYLRVPPVFFYVPAIFFCCLQKNCSCMQKNYSCLQKNCSCLQNNCRCLSYNFYAVDGHFYLCV
jgi:hypothetical protein